MPDHLVAEILDGLLITHPRPAARPARAASRLGAEGVTGLEDGCCSTAQQDDIHHVMHAA